MGLPRSAGHFMFLSYFIESIIDPPPEVKLSIRKYSFLELFLVLF